MSKLSAAYLALFNHENYHGWFKRRKFFEGWYFKIVSANGNHAFAIIPGVAMDKQGKKQSFIQVLDGIANEAKYHSFLFQEFRSSEKKFKINIGENSFSKNRLNLSLPDLKGKINFLEPIEWKKKLTAPGIMGWYSFVPFMECYHQVISLDFQLVGKLMYRNKEINFNGGRGYLEKDWGRSFPSSWIWMQSNGFPEVKTCFKLSIAKIPWVGTSFIGFIAAFYYKEKLYKFATYTGAKLTSVIVTVSHVNITLEDKNFMLEVSATRPPGGELAAPILGIMDGRVHESMTSELHVKIQNKQDKTILFQQTGKNGGIEVAGNIEEILQGYKK